ncbi:hypothetical protein AB0D34_36135 [Streptomyces sp. NPDC048420]|uniref:hypothetical protein n=1 Tax=Streptomyces sp. NPDC048420 TaxID=3155755 RepID=UPI0034264D32
MTASSKWRAVLAATAASAALAVVPVLGAQPAFADPYPAAYPPPVPNLTIDPTAVEPGDEVDFRGTGFQAEQDVVAALASKVVILGHFEADATGAVEGTVTIPERTKPGEHRFLLRAENPERNLSTELTVLGDPGQDHGGDPGHDHGGDPGGDPGHHHGSEPGHNHGGRPHLAHTGGERSALLAGGAAGLLLLGGGAVFLTRRAKRG